MEYQDLSKLLTTLWTNHAEPKPADLTSAWYAVLSGKFSFDEVVRVISVYSDYQCEMFCYPSSPKEDQPPKPTDAPTKKLLDPSDPSRILTKEEVRSFFYAGMGILGNRRAQKELDKVMLVKTLKNPDRVAEETEGHPLRQQIDRILAKHGFKTLTESPTEEFEDLQLANLMVQDDGRLANLWAAWDIMESDDFEQMVNIYMRIMLQIADKEVIEELMEHWKLTSKEFYDLLLDRIYETFFTNVQSYEDWFLRYEQECQKED